MGQDEGRARILRWLGLGVGVCFLVLAAGLVFRLPWAVHLWPFGARETRLGFIFLGSVAAGTAVSTMWVGLSGEVRAAEAGGADVALIFGGMAVYFARRWLATGQATLVWAAAVCAAGGALGAGVWILGRRGSWRDRRPMPRFLRVSLAIVVGIALLEGVALLARAPRVFPWPLAPETSIMYGLIFVGAIPFFGAGVLRPMWANATAPLLALLAYDVVLTGPFLMHFATVRAAHRASLVVYSAVLLSTGVLALYYLFINGSTRFGARPPFDHNPT